jgi:hypothetical protein
VPGRAIRRVIGRFDFLGYRFLPSGIVGVVIETVQFVERMARFYEQGADEIRIEDSFDAGGRGCGAD